MMKKGFPVLIILSLSLVFLSTPSLSKVRSGKPDNAARLKAVETYGKLPLSFIENRGQVGKKVSFYLNGKRGTIYFTREAIVYDLILPKSLPSNPAEKKPREGEHLSFTLKPIGAREDARLIAAERLPGKVNYFVGNDPKKWHTDIPIYREIIYKGLFTGIDLRLYGTNNQMEYDFIVNPGADPKDIRMGFEGIQGLEVNHEGNLIIKTAFGHLKHLKPVIYQEIKGTRQIVKGSFKVAKNKRRFGFDVENYNNHYPLVIDPLTLSYSTFLGGSDEDHGLGIAVDSSGNAYVMGSTKSTDFPTEIPYQGSHGGGRSDVFVAKLGPAGNTLSYSTYLGGSGDDYGGGIAVDSSGNAYVTGLTRSTDFPTQNPYQGTHGGGDVFDTPDDAFVTKLGSAGNTLSYSTYLGGSGADHGVGIAVDSSGNAYVTGLTRSTDFPTQNPYQGTYAGGYWDGFVTKLGPAGNTLSYSTYLGGSGADHAVGIAVDSSGNAYVTGNTWSTDFPTENPYQGSQGGGNFSVDVFVTKLGSAGNTLSYSTYLGGSGDEYGRGIAVDSSGNAYVTGDTWSTDFPTENSYQGIYLDGMDGFVTKLGPAGNTLSYSTYLGGNAQDTGGGIAVDSSGNAYVTGLTRSTDFPTENPYQGIYGGVMDVFVTKLGSAGNTLSYSTYLGGSGADHAVGIAVDSSGNAYVTGYTSSTDFPTENPYQGTHVGGYWHGFVTKLIEVPGLVTGLGSYPPNGGWIEVFGGKYSAADWLRVGWGTYNSTNGGARIATGDIDGDGRDEIILGLAPVAGDPGIPGGWFQILDNDHKHLAWGRIQWGAYNTANGESRPACGDVDGDGMDEIIIGLGSYPSSGGWFEIFDYTPGHVTHKAWKRVNWGEYNSQSGETRPACGDVDGDGYDEIIIGLDGNGGGWLEVFDDATTGYVHVAWPRIHWSAYNSANGESWPACGDVDGDGEDEIIIGLGSCPSSGGWFEIFDYTPGNMAHKAWKRVNWGEYNSQSGETRPACGDVDGDGYDEIIIGLDGNGGGWLEVFDDATTGYVHVAWPRIHWSTYNSVNGESWPAVKK